MAGVGTMLLGTAVPAQERETTSSATGIITGRITEVLKETPVADASVRVLGQETATQSDSSGRFTLRGVRI
ncbi:MAG: hypothetical protein H7Z40_17760, partial [Phycisphaerae bacterium]|nr:hypothetical protein [Gemmatimonadaceae bacterium]